MRHRICPQLIIAAFAKEAHGGSCDQRLYDAARHMAEIPFEKMMRKIDAEYRKVNKELWNLITTTHAINEYGQRLKLDRRFPLYFNKGQLHHMKIGKIWLEQDLAYGNVHIPGVRMITSLKENQVFVFGSNESGRHGKGAALTARRKFGAIYGQAEGLQGQSYGIPTVNATITAKLPLDEIEHYVKRFYAFAETRPDLEFLVTAIGCGLAGHKVEDIAPMFHSTENVKLCHEFGGHE